MSRSDSEILLELLHSLQELDTYSDIKAIAHFENLIHKAIDEVGDDRITEWYRQKIGPEKYDALLEEVRREIERKK